MISNDSQAVIAAVYTQKSTSYKLFYSGSLSNILMLIFYLHFACYTFCCICFVCKYNLS